MVPLMSESMERSLRLREWLQLRLHLLVCAWCMQYLKQINFIRRLLREDTPNQRSANSRDFLDAETRQRISTSLRNQ
jgi:hypothetical protein